MAENNMATKPIGVTGLSYWRGLVSEEYLNQLKGTRAFKVYQEMSDDCTIGALLDAIIMPLLSAEFFVEPASEDKADVEAAEFFESCRDDLNGYTWRQHVLDMMSALVYGFSLGEIVLKKRAGDKGKPGSHFEDGRVGISTIDPRAQTSLDRWQMDEQAHVTGFIQRDPNTGTYYEIPAEKLVHWAWRQEKRNPEGKSAMRSLYRSWYMRKNLEIIESIGIERDLAGLPMIKLPYGATEADAAKALVIVRNLRNDEEAGIVLPGPPRADKEAAGWELSLLGGGGKQYNARETIRDYDKKILMRFFAQFLLLGMDKVGTQALVKGSQDFFALALRSIQQELLEAWNAQLIPYVFRFNNFTGLTGLPRLNWADPGKADIAGLTALLRDMTAAQIITASAELEDHVRSVAGLPDRPEGLGEGPRNVPAPAPAPVPGLPFAKKPYGGEGSGNWGHEGRPGEIGGSAPGGGGGGGGLSLEAPRTFVESRKDIITTGKAKEVQKVRNEYLAEQGYSKEEIKRLDEMQNGWMRGVYNPQAQVMRQVATSEFGKDWPDDEYHDSAKVTDMMPSDRDIAIIQANRGFAVEAMRAKYGDEITVYRGVMGEQGAKIRETLGAGGEVDVGVNSLSSWSLHAKGADYFARNGGAILTAKVPVSEIWASADISTEFTIGEKEVVIGSRSGKQRVTEYTGKRKKKTRYAAIELVIVDDDPINANWIKAAAQEANNEPDDADVSYGGSEDDDGDGAGSEYASIAGTDARDARTKKARLTNDYQAALLQLYDEWSKALVESLPAEPTKAQVTAALNERLPQYGHGMRELGADYIVQAVQMGAKADAAKADKALQKLIAERVKSNDAYINDSLLPDIRAKILAHMEEQAHFARRDYQFDLPALLGAFATMRVRVGSYAGQAWYGIFAGALLQGRRETEEAKKAGRKTKRVRWVLDPTAEHCAERPGYFGCPDLAHEYPSWDDLATVPGGQVACLSGCRCHIEVEEENGWQWV